MSARARAVVGLVLMGLAFVLLLAAMAQALMGDWNTSIYLALLSLILMTASGFVAASAPATMAMAVRTFKVKTEITCPSCGLKEVRDFSKGDYVFKPAEECPRCGGERFISSIFREEERKPKPPPEEL